MPSSELTRRQMSRPIIAALAVEQTQIPEDFVGQFIAPDFQVDEFRFDFPIFGNEHFEAEDDDAVGLFGEFKEVRIGEKMDSASLFERGRKAKIARSELQAAQAAERRMPGAVQNLKVRYASVLRAQVLRRN